MLARAAEDLRYSEAKVRDVAIRTRDRLARRRGRAFDFLGDLDYYLMHVAGALGPDDL